MRNKFGFTLLELMMVIAIIGILSTIAIPNWISWRANQMLNSSARNLRADLQLARVTAIKEYNNAVIDFRPAAGEYAITGKSGTSVKKLPGNVTFGQPQYPDLTNVNRVTFNPRGMPDIINQLLIPLSLTNGRNISITITIAGSISISD